MKKPAGQWPGGRWVECERSDIAAAGDENGIAGAAQRTDLGDFRGNAAAAVMFVTATTVSEGIAQCADDIRRARGSSHGDEQHLAERVTGRVPAARLGWWQDFCGADGKRLVKIAPTIPVTMREADG